MQPELSERDVEWLLDAYADVLEQHGYNAIQVETIDLSGHPEWTEDMFRNAMRGGAYRSRKNQMLLRLDADVIAWFRQRHPDCQTAMNTALRAFMNAHSDEETDDTDLRKTA